VNNRQRDSTDGPGVTEFSLILVLIAVVVIVALVQFGGQTSSVLNAVSQPV
jgi:Flp pilus assembly pilin Flp